MEKRTGPLRKGLLILIFLLVMATAARAQALSCSVNGAVTPSVPSSKVDALVGDMVLTCTGGTPTANGVAVPQVTLTLSLNTTVTSKVDAGQNSEALLTIDEPLSGVPGAPLVQSFCASTVPCAILGNGTGVGTYDAQPNVFQGVSNANQATWTFPLDPPGVGLTRTMRITNIRAAASLLGAGAQVLGSVTLPGVTLFSPVQTLAFVVGGAVFSLRDSAGASTSGINFSAASSHNQALSTNVNASGCVDFRLRYTEAFGTAFMIRNVAGGGATPPAAQNLPGALYNTETGFYNPAFPALGTGLGLADHGTRLIARFNNVPTGVRIYVSSAAVSASGGTVAQLINAASDGSGAFSALAGTGSIDPACPNITSGSIAQVAVAGGTGYAVWEVTGDNINSSGTMDFAVVTAWTSGQPATGTATVTLDFAPTSSANTGSLTAPNPRFAATASAQSMLTISNTVSVPVLSPGSFVILVVVLGILAATTMRRLARAEDGE